MYPRVLRNVCVLVIVVNPLISLLSMGVLPHALAAGVKNHLVSSAAYAAQGHWLHVLVTLDAVLVLSGSVLTAFIGVQGLAYRMALDGALPQALTSLSALRGTQHVSVLLFFLVAVSLHVLCAADIRVLSGVYTMSFVALLVCFVCGNMLLKRYRGALPRRSPASRTSVLLALTGALLGLAGTAANQPDMALYAVFYVSVVFAVVLACLHRLAILRAVAAALSALNVGARTKAAAVEQIAREQHMGLVFFLQNESNDDLRQVCRYILQNEERRLLKVVKVTPTPLAPAELVRAQKLAFFSHASLLCLCISERILCIVCNVAFVFQRHSFFIVFPVNLCISRSFLCGRVSTRWPPKCPCGRVRPPSPSRPRSARRLTSTTLLPTPAALGAPQSAVNLLRLRTRTRMLG